MLKPHQTPAYALARLRQIRYQRKNPLAPWLVPRSIELLDQLIKSSDVAMEYGSGRSTKWLASRCAKLVSIEHNRDYFELVSAQLKDVGNAEVLFRPLADSGLSQPGYIDPIKSLRDDSIDLVLDDGRRRDEVALIAVEKLRAGGVLVVDNAERYLTNEFTVPESRGPSVEGMSESWRSFSELVQGWRRIWSSDGVCTTLILFKP